MLPFAFRQFELDGRFHVPLPKMLPGQVKTIRRRLESIGFRTEGDNPLRASKRGTRILVHQWGLCSSNEDLSDAIAPALPELLELEHGRVPLWVLRESYFASECRPGALLLRLKPRLEAERFWDGLRSQGTCALTPDERAVYAAVLSWRALSTPLVTDFPVEGSVVKRIGHRQYYDSRLEPREAAFTLRGIGPSRERNTYLPRNSLLRLSPSPLPERRLLALLGEPNDWCLLSLR